MRNLNLLENFPNELSDSDLEMVVGGKSKEQHILGFIVVAAATFAGLNPLVIPLW